MIAKQRLGREKTRENNPVGPDSYDYDVACVAYYVYLDPKANVVCFFLLLNRPPESTALAAGSLKRDQKHRCFVQAKDVPQLGKRSSGPRP